ncbi:MAG: tetratricopeptide repeat protein [Smithella sp.]|jgi:Tfp pilus assembly protein PilF
MTNKPDIHSQKQKMIIYVVLIIVTLAVFGQVYKYDFTNFDDYANITENLQIQKGISPDGFRWALTTRYFDLWNPMLWLSFMLDYQFYGADAGGYHVTNLILHILSTLLLFWLFCRMTGDIWPSAFVAAFFALHPLHVESVAWVSERKDTLSAFFWMITLCFHVYYTEKPNIKRYLPAVFCFMLALMSKPMVITLPLILILLDYWPLRRFPFQVNRPVRADISPVPTKQKKLKKRENISAIGKSALPEVKMMLFGADRWRLLEKIPFFTLSIILVIITLHAPEATGTTSAKYFPWSALLANAPVSFVTYLMKTFWPYDLAVLYPFTEQILLWQIAVSVLLIIIICTLINAKAKKFPHLFTGWFWFLITILPVIGILQISVTTPYAMADRYHYLPSIGLAVMMAWGLPSLIKNENMRKKIFLPAAIIFLGIMAVFSCRQCAFWKNSETLFNHTLMVTKNNYVIQTFLGNFLSDEGRSQEALEHLNESIRIKPDYDDAYSYRGIIFAKLGNNQLAIEDINKAIGLNPNNSIAYINRGIIYSALGQYQQAVESYNDAIRLKPDCAGGYYNRGILYNYLGQNQSAIEDINKTIQLSPDYVPAYHIRAAIYLNQGNKEMGCSDLQKACELGNCEILKSARDRGYCP